MSHFEIVTVENGEASNDVMGIRKESVEKLIDVLRNLDAAYELVDLERGEIIGECESWLRQLDKHGTYATPNPRR